MVSLKLKTFAEQIFLNTVFIKNLTDKEGGTGFLMEKSIDEERKKILLFSNKHVLWGKADKDTPHIKKDISFALHFQNPDGTYDLGNVKEFLCRDTERDWGDYKESKNEDVGALNISALYKMPGFKSGMGSLPSSFLTYDYSEIAAGTEIIFVGYPSLYYDKKNTLPIMRKGAIASIPLVDFNGQKKILIDAQVFEGASGSPVFVLLNNNYKLLGMVESTLSLPMDSAPRVKLATKMNTKGELEECFGLAHVIKKEAIQEVYDMF